MNKPPGGPASDLRSALDQAGVRRGSSAPIAYREPGKSDADGSTDVTYEVPTLDGGVEERTVRVEASGPRMDDVVEVRLTGRVVGRDGDRLLVMLRHPSDGSQLTELYFAAADVVILERHA